jgi:hypothetical protein
MVENPFARFATPSSEQPQSGKNENPFARFSTGTTSSTPSASPAADKSFVSSYGEGSFDAGPSVPMETAPMVIGPMGQRAAQRGVYAPSVPQSEKLPPSVAARELAIGAATGVPGFFGSAEALGRKGLQALGADVDTSPFLPTSERYAELGSDLPVVGEYLADVKAPKLRSAGEFFSPIPGGGALSKVLSKAGELVVPTMAKGTEKSAQFLESLGMKIEAPQLSPMGKYETAGFTKKNIDKNQRIANVESSKATGVSTENITPEFIQKRLKNLSNDYKIIFNRDFKLDSTTLSELKNLRDFELRVRPGSESEIIKTADNIISRGANAPIPGNELQRLRELISDSARTDVKNNYEFGQFLNSLDKGIERFAPTVAKDLQRTNRYYAATKTLEDGIKDGWIAKDRISLSRLGDYLSNRTSGYGSGVSKHPLYDLGYAGKDVGQLATWETGVKLGDIPKTSLAKILGTATVLPRTQTARSLQRIRENLPEVPTGLVSIPAGAAGRAVQDEEQ